MTKMNYYQAASVSQAIDYLKQYRGQAMLLAGGTDIMVLMNQYEIPENTVFIGIEDIPELKQINFQNDGIHIGSMVTDSELMESELIKEKAAAKVTLSADKKIITSITIAAGACAPTIVRLKQLEQALTGQPADTNTVSRNVHLALKDISPITDMIGTKWYRKEMIRVFAERAVNGAIANAAKKEG